MGAELENAGEDFDVCSDVADNWGCCFASYGHYVEKHAANASIVALRNIKAQCSNSKPACECSFNSYPGAKTEKDYRVCSRGR